MVVERQDSSGAIIFEKDEDGKTLDRLLKDIKRIESKIKKLEKEIAELKK